MRATFAVERPLGADEHEPVYIGVEAVVGRDDALDGGFVRAGRNVRYLRIVRSDRSILAGILDG